MIDWWIPLYWGFSAICGWELGGYLYKYVKKQWLIRKGRFYQIKKGKSMITLIASSPEDLEKMKNNLVLEEKSSDA